MNINDMFDLSSKVILITGASGTLGHAFAESLANAGAKLLLVDKRITPILNLQKKIQKKGGKITIFKADVTKEKDVENTFKHCINQFGSLDVLVNNVGISKISPSIDMQLADWNKVVNVNLNSVFLCSKESAKYMIKQRRGKIINLASIYGLIADRFPISAYYASKAAIVNLTKALAIEWGRYRINVNAIAPSFFMSRMTKDFFEDFNIRNYILDKTPVRRLAETKDIIGSLIFLASSASDYITGQTIVVDGGWTAW